MTTIDIRERFTDDKIRIEQDEVLVDGFRVGYVGTQENAPITLLEPVAESTMQLIKHAVNQRDQMLVRDRVVSVAPTELPSAAESDDEDDDE